MRKKPPNKRLAITARIKHRYHSGNEQPLVVTYGPTEDGVVQEIFCASFKVGDDMMSLIMDVSILVSRCLQHGDTLEELARTLCEPRSIIGSIVDSGIELEQHLQEPIEHKGVE